MSVNETSIKSRMPQEPLPVPAIDDIQPVPDMSPESQSFVVIKSAADLDELLDDSDIADISMDLENRQILQEELALFDQPSSPPQPSLQKISSIQSNGAPEPISKLQSDPCVDDNGGNDMNRSVLPALPQPQLHSREDMGDHDNRTISIVSFAPNDFGSEEIEAKVTQLIEENMHLKDTVLQNNLSMKTQYDRIVAWQKDVEKVHETHKEKFRDAKKCIDMLKQELVCLRQDNEFLRDALQLERSEHERNKERLVGTSQSVKNDSELDAAKGKVFELEKALQELTIETEKQVALKDANWKAMEEKLTRYEKELENAYRQIRESKEALDKKDIDKLKLAQEKLLLSEMANERANNEILSLRNQLAKTMQATDEVTKLRCVLDQAVAEKNALAASLESRTANVMDLNLRCTKLEESLQEAKNTNHQYMDTIKQLKENEEQAKIEAWMSKQKLSEVEQKQSNAQSDFNYSELAYIRHQLMNSQKALLESEQNRAVAEARVETMKNDIVELRRQLESKQENHDDGFVFRSQLEIYKSDFEAEREAKEEVKREKNKIVEDLQHLSRRNQQLQEEVEILREQLQGNSFRRPSSSRNETAKTINEHIYKCPKCDFGFKTLRAAENHVMRCIELDDTLP